MLSMRHLAVLGVAVAALDAAPTRAQSADTTAVAVFNSVVVFRRAWLGDSTPFVTCSVYEALGRPANLLRLVSSGAAPLLRGDVSVCETVPAPVTSAWCPKVKVDSLVIDDSLATVNLMVQRKEYGYDEHYKLKRVRLGRTRFIDVWSIQDVTISGIWQAHLGFGPGDPPAVCKP